MSKTVLITGSSSGIGKATAKYFAEKGWNVIATMRTPEKEAELTQLDNVLVTRLDVQDLDSINNAIAEGISKFDKIDVVVNNAGYGSYGTLESIPRENIVRQFDVNVMGVLDVTKAIIPHFRENKDGILINITSVGGKITLPLGSLYHGTKFAVEGITEALHYEMETIGVKVKLVEPGAIKTDFAGRSFDFNHDENLTEYNEMVAKLFEGIEVIMGTGSEASLVAGVIYEAATDGTNTIRYIAGPDAEEWIKNRKELDDETFIGGLKAQFGF